MNVDANEMVIDGVVIRATDWYRPMHQRQSFKQLIWHYTATSAVTGEPVPQYFHAMAVNPGDAEEEAIIGAQLRMQQFIADAKAGKGYIESQDLAWMILTSIREVLCDHQEAEGSLVQLNDELDDALHRAVRHANEEYESRLSTLTRLGGDPSDWSIPIVPIQEDMDAL